MGGRCVLATSRGSLARQLGLPFVIENPANSRLWKWPALQRELRHHSISDVVLDMCCFDAAWKKPTRLVGTLPLLELLGGRCPGHPRHVRLQGVVEVEGKRLWRTKFAAAYPPRLCRAVAAVAGDAAPRSAWRRPGEAEELACWEQRLAAAVRR